MGVHREIATWLIAGRHQIEAAMKARLGSDAPSAGADESEVLRRFRAYAAAALRRGAAAQPAVDGLQVDERRVLLLLGAWCEAAAETAGDNGDAVRAALAPLLGTFRSRLRTTGARRRARGAPRSKRRAVIAAIDRVSDAFLAVDANSGRLVDANPAAGSLLGVARDALLGVDALSFVAPEDREMWWTQFDAVTEGSEPGRFRSRLIDARGESVTVECSVTRFAQRGRTLALVIARPV